MVLNDKDSDSEKSSSESEPDHNGQTCTTKEEADKCPHLCCNKKGNFCSTSYGKCGKIFSKDSCLQMFEDKTCSTCCFRKNNKHWCGTKEDCDDAIKTRIIIFAVCGGVAVIIIVVMICLCCKYKDGVKKKYKNFKKWLGC